MPGAVTPYLMGLLETPMKEGLAQAWKSYGAPLERMEMRLVAGRPYLRVRPIGAPDEPRGAPPRFVFKALFLLHPELRRRKKRAAEVFDKKLWRDDVARWHEELAPAYRARNLELQAVCLEELDDAALASHLRELNAACQEAIKQHFVQSPAHNIPVGDFLAHASMWTQSSVAACAQPLRGSSPASKETLELIDAIAAALREDRDARRELDEAHDPARKPAERLARLHRWPGEVGRTFEAYLCEHGNRIVTGFDISDHRLFELPEVVLNTVKARLAGSEDPALQPNDAIRDRVPVDHRAEYDDLLGEARAVLGLRDDDVGVGWIWRKGLTRRALLHAGERLQARGAIHDQSHVFEAEPDELIELVMGNGPTAAAMHRRAVERRELQELDPPLTLGEPESPPPDDYFPAAIARMQRAVMTYIAHFDSDAAPVASVTDGASGHAVSGGLYEGRARIVLGPADFARIERGDVLIARTTSPTYNVLLPLLGAVVTDRGGCLSHAAIVAREYGIPGVVGCGDATTTIPDGSIVRVDGDAGTVVVIGHGEQPSDVPAGGPDETTRAPTARPGGVCVALREADDVARFGGKSASLGASLREGLPVPDGLAIDVALTESIAAGDPDALAMLTAQLSKVEGPVAVRSSAAAEDGKSASFAGQHLTVLGVEGVDAVVDAIEKVWRSGRTKSALAYRERMGIEGEPRVAVAVQRLVDPVCAGVLFTRDPVSGADVRVIEATWGLGEAVVAGVVTPDHYRLTRDGNVEEKRAGEKDLAIRRNPSRGTCEVPVEGEDVSRLCLDEGKLAELHELATRCERVFGGPQDIEFAFDEERLYLLQSRAVTT